jgi:hypothetical protein
MNQPPVAAPPGAEKTAADEDGVIIRRPRRGIARQSAY